MTSRFVSGLSAISDRWLTVERAICGALVASVLILIVLNVLTRALNVALFWVDELAVYAMIWMAMFGASALTRQRKHVGVTLVAGSLSRTNRHYLAILAHGLVLLFAASLIAMCVVWFDPIELAKNSFDIDAYTGSTFNFIYKEPTNTLGIQKFWFWLAVPMAAVSMTLHAAANFCEEVFSAMDQIC